VSIFERITCKPVDIDSGISDDGLSVEVTMDVQLRIPPSYTTDGIHEIADGHLTVGTVNWDGRIESVTQSPRTAVTRAFRAAIRQEGGDPTLLCKTGTSDMNVYVREWDCSMVTYGSGDSALDHAPSEHIKLPEFDRSVAVFEGFQVDEDPLGDRYLIHCLPAHRARK